MEQLSHSTESASPSRFLTTPGVSDALSICSCSMRRRTFHHIGVYALPSLLCCLFDAFFFALLRHELCVLVILVIPFPFAGCTCFAAHPKHQLSVYSYRYYIISFRVVHSANTSWSMHFPQFIAFFLCNIPSCVLHGVGVY